MTAPTSPLLQALADIKPRGCTAGHAINRLTPIEQEAFTDALRARVLPLTNLAQVFSDTTGAHVTARQMRAHRVGECSCE